jgi:hypothetical protein
VPQPSWETAATAAAALAVTGSLGEPVALLGGSGLVLGYLPSDLDRYALASEAFTVEGRFYLTARPIAAPELVPLFVCGLLRVQPTWGVGITGAGTVVFFWDLVGNGQWHTVPLPTILAETWYHLAIVGNDTTLQVFCNGVHCVTAPRLPTLYFFAQNPIWSWGGPGIWGWLDQAMIFARPRWWSHGSTTGSGAVFVPPIAPYLPGLTWGAGGYLTLVPADGVVPSWDLLSCWVAWSSNECCWYIGGVAEAAVTNTTNLGIVVWGGSPTVTPQLGLLDWQYQVHETSQLGSVPAALEPQPGTWIHLLWDRLRGDLYCDGVRMLTGVGVGATVPPLLVMGPLWQVDAARSVAAQQVGVRYLWIGTNPDPLEVTAATLATLANSGRTGAIPELAGAEVVGWWPLQTDTSNAAAGSAAPAVDWVANRYYNGIMCDLYV